MVTLCSIVSVLHTADGNTGSRPQPGHAGVPGPAGSAARGDPGAASDRARYCCVCHRCSTGTDVAPRRSPAFPGLSVHQVRGILWSFPVAGAPQTPAWLRGSTCCKAPLWLLKFPFHEQMKHFILYDFPTMAVIPFHLSGTRDDGGRTRAPGNWQPALSMREHTFTFT